MLVLLETRTRDPDRQHGAAAADDIGTSDSVASTAMLQFTVGTIRRKSSTTLSRPDVRVSAVAPDLFPRRSRFSRSSDLGTPLHARVSRVSPRADGSGIRLRLSRRSLIRNLSTTPASRTSDTYPAAHDRHDSRGALCRICADQGASHARRAAGYLHSRRADSALLAADSLRPTRAMSFLSVSMAVAASLLFSAVTHRRSGAGSRRALMVFGVFNRCTFRERSDALHAERTAGSVGEAGQWRDDREHSHNDSTAPNSATCPETTRRWTCTTSRRDLAVGLSNWRIQRHTIRESRPHVSRFGVGLPHSTIVVRK